MKLLVSTLILMCFGFSGGTGAGEVSVAVASNFTAPMKALTQEFENQSGHRVVLSFGSSGKLFAQISHGAPYDIFLSADQSKPRILEQKGMAVPGSRFTYARGILALWSTDPAPEARLSSGQVSRIAIANPRLAPYGIAAIETLKAINSYKAVKSKLVKAENVSQSYQFTYTNNAELGFVALSQVTSRADPQTGDQGPPSWPINRGYAWVVPDNLHSPILQDAVLLPSGKDKEAATALLNFLKADATRALIAAYGYHSQLPDTTP